ncbi:MAG TPA: nuclear transport factor 2 family protein [Chitinophagaceae bacterium]|jgi:uncharacterized protein DUF4440|nr:nuclear transport factor 2 family protein [Chitinophagaceae bacterium]
MRHLLLLILIPGIAIASFAQSSNDEATLISINRQFIRNFLNNDTVEHSKIIHASNFLFIGTNGKLLDRNEYMQGWAHGYDKTVMPEFDLEEVQVRLFDNMALIVAKTRVKKVKDGTIFTGETRYTDTYVKEKGEWKCVQVQLTRIAN